MFMASMHFSSRTHACSLLFAAGLRFAAVCVAQNLARWQTCFPHWRWLLWIGFGSGTTARAFPRTPDGVHFPKSSRKTFMKRTTSLTLLPDNRTFQKVAEYDSGIMLFQSEGMWNVESWSYVRALVRPIGPDLLLSVHADHMPTEQSLK